MCCRISLLAYIFVLLVIRPCFSVDLITQNKPFKDGDVLISEGEIFELGFFSPGTSINRFVGVRYYKIPEKNVVWVANRDIPVTNTSGVLSIDKTGRLVLSYSGTPQDPVWSSNISASGDSNFSAKLLDTGNLVVFKDDYSEQNVIWQGFDHPTDTHLPGMKISLNKKTGESKFITSWKSPENPGTGQYSLKFEVNESNSQLFIYNGLERLMRVGPWNGLTFSGYPEYTVSGVDKLSRQYYVDNEEEVSWYYTINNPENITRFVMNETRGLGERLNWDPVLQKWYAFWTGPEDPCDFYRHCGAFSNCNPANVGQQGCECLPGYKSKGDSLTDRSQCLTKSESLVCRNGEGFIEVPRIKVPDTSNAHMEPDFGIKACNNLCLNNCSCTGYTIANVSNGSGCFTWYRDLVDIRQFSNGGQVLYLRVDHAELVSGNDSKKRLLKVLLPVVLVILLTLLLPYWLHRNKKTRVTEGDDGQLELFDSPQNNDERGTSSTEVHPFLLRTIVAATDNFSLSKKLGEGGFGTVYKGQLQGGQEIAVKKLSITSSQGIEEFKNEIILIAKLQHRNLVQLLGYCIQEKMLVYEFLPNGGLDCFIFAKKSVLNWRTRFEIAMGIARGMIYLHQDSRLRIIHRDLKASNVLLDASMNPKISDFGMARIFSSDQNEDTTRRVVGTYGYMSPEYAMEGLFSIKSDVFSFGVLLLEIISGRRNNSNFDRENTLNLIGHVWDQWLKDTPLEIVDPSLGEPYAVSEVLRCIHVGLLCVQESAAVRPTMSEVASMLSNERTPPSQPEQPAFINRATRYFGPVRSCSYSGLGATALSEMTISTIEGR
ncbi:G-type lectin S-receptor-like serine/threonine-protein kinase At1g11410 [Apium graveolens]|uniref:G-type lectin S-receptor-like serine/threonine-protein kinase At1g11410 n=1 Tax=Apium graveolens TaxID=4045 RepID=UPI003D7A4D19